MQEERLHGLQQCQAHPFRMKLSSASWVGGGGSLQKGIIRSSIRPFALELECKNTPALQVSLFYDVMLIFGGRMNRMQFGEFVKT